MRAASMLGSVLLLAACAPMEWTKTNAAPEQVSRDERECNQLARREASLGEMFHPPVTPVYARDERGRGPFIWPTGSAVDPYSRQVDEGQVAQSCMQSRGYSLVRAARQ